MIEFFFKDDSDKRLVEKYKGRVTLLERAVIDKMDQLDILMQRKAQGKLEGEVLHSHTHKLANSVRVIPAVKEGTAVVGRVQAGGGPAWYARVQELGARIPEVSGKLMVFPGAERQALVAALGKTRTRQILGRGGMVFTMRHRAFDLPARPFMSTTQEEMRPQYLAEVQKTIADVLSGGRG